jgi:dimethylargininase
LAQQEARFVKLATTISTLMFTRAIVRPPAPNFAEGLTTADLGAPNYRRALKQHEAYCAALEQCGLTLIRLEADPRYPDSTFVEDTAVLVEALPHRPHPSRAARLGTPGRASAPASAKTHPLTQVVLTRPQAVLTRPGAPSRTGEVESMRRVLADFFPSIGEIQSPGTLDGGDVCEAGNHFFIGISERTNEAGAQQLAELFAPFGYTSNLVDIQGLNGMESVPGAIATGSVLHMKSGLAWLGDNRLVVIDALADRAEFSRYDLVRVSDEEMYAANCIRVNDHVLVAAGYPAFAGTLRELGYQTIELEMSEFQKMDGGLSCLSLRF